MGGTTPRDVSAAHISAERPFDHGARGVEPGADPERREADAAAPAACMDVPTFDSKPAVSSRATSECGGALAPQPSAPSSLGVPPLSVRYAVAVRDLEQRRLRALPNEANPRGGAVDGLDRDAGEAADLPVGQALLAELLDVTSGLGGSTTSTKLPLP
jgi:hypothetical protein